MAFPVPSREQLSRYFLQIYSALLPSRSIARGTDPYVYARAVSGLCWSILSRLLYFEKIAAPDNVVGAIRWGKVYDFQKLGPQPSQGALALRVGGTPATAVTTGLELAHQDGTLIKVASVGAVVGGGGTVDVDVLSITLGQAANKITGEKFNFLNPPPGITTEATLVKDLTYGVDNESPEDYLQRLIAHIGEPPQGGAIHDYVEWALKIPGVGFAYVWRHRRGKGTVDVAVLGRGRGTARVLTIASDLGELIETNRPAGAKDFAILTMLPTAQDVAVLTECDESRFKWDWLDNGLSTYIITAHNQGAQTITVPGLPSTVTAGKRITVRGEEARVASRVGDVLTIAFEQEDASAPPQTWFTFAVTNGADFVRASGDIVRPARTAILKLFDRLGPARDPRYAATSWPSKLLVDDVIASAKSVVGEGHKVVVSVPGADVDVTDPLNGTTELPFLTPGKVQVWRKF